jgi:hypothetical protein
LRSQVPDNFTQILKRAYLQPVTGWLRKTPR